jgi:ornithine carbamoyltransferase
MSGTNVPHALEEHERLHTPLRGRDLLSLRDVTPDEARGLFVLADRMKADPVKFSMSLRSKTLAMIFEKPSLRTRVSFDVGMTQLGGHAIDLSPEISLGRRESLHDVAKNLERMVQAIMVRTYAHEGLERLAEHASIPVINGLTDFSHPCQGLADYLTMRESKGELSGLRVAYVGDGNNVCHSLMFGAALVGAHLFVATPRGYEPDAGAVEWTHRQAPATGGRLVVTESADDAVRDADVVYTDVWASMGQEAEAAVRREVFASYQVNPRLFSLAKPDAIFMHCLPAHRGDEVTDEVIDSPNSVVFQQAENRLHVQKALLFSLMR